MVETDDLAFGLSRVVTQRLLQREGLIVGVLEKLRPELVQANFAVSDG